MSPRRIARWAVVGALALAAGACAGPCMVTSDKLASLERGMTPDQAAGVMGCAGRPVTVKLPTSEESTILEWTGPGSVFMATLATFSEGRLVSYTTVSRSGY